MELDANETEHMFIFVDEAGFKLAKRRRRGVNVIGEKGNYR